MLIACEDFSMPSLTAVRKMHEELPFHWQKVFSNISLAIRKVENPEPDRRPVKFEVSFVVPSSRDFKKTSAQIKRFINKKGVSWVCPYYNICKQKELQQKDFLFDQILAVGMAGTGTWFSEPMFREICRKVANRHFPETKVQSNYRDLFLNCLPSIAIPELRCALDPEDLSFAMNLDEELARMTGHLSLTE